jgi:hypothetical protein
MELYNIPEDPMELDNRAGTKPAIVQQMSARTMEWQKTLPPGPIDPSAGRNDWNWPKQAASK